MNAALRAHWALGIAVGAVVFCATAASSASILRTQDLYLHIAIGRWILFHGAIPYHDVFSATVPGVPWVAHEWLAGVAWAAMYDSFGWGGIMAMVAMCLAVAVGLVAMDVSRTLGPWAGLASAVVSFGLCVNHVFARPHMAVLPLLVVWMIAHVRARQRNGTPSLWLLIAMVLWANLHGSFMLGIVFTGLFAAEAVFEAKDRRDALAQARSWAIFLAAAVLAAAVTPHGPRGLLFPFEMLGMKAAVQNIYEWQASSLENNGPLVLFVVLLVFVTLLHGVKVPLARLAMFTLLLYMAFSHRRHTELLGLSAPVLLQHAIAANLPPGAAVTGWGLLDKAAMRRGVVVASLMLAGAGTWVFCRDLARKPDHYTPAAALAVVEARGIRGPVLNAQNFGGYFIFRGYKPFVDGRVDMYGDAFMTRYLDPASLPGLIEQYGIAWTIFEPWNPRAAQMERMQGWSRIHADETAIVHVRQAASPR